MSQPAVGCVPAPSASTSNQHLERRLDSTEFQYETDQCSTIEARMRLVGGVGRGSSLGTPSAPARRERAFPRQRALPAGGTSRSTRSAPAPTKHMSGIMQCNVLWFCLVG